MIHSWHTAAAGVMMRGTDEAAGSLFSYVDLEERVPTRRPLRLIRRIVNDALASLNSVPRVLPSDKLTGRCLLKSRVWRI